MKSLKILAIAILPLGLIIAAVPENTTRPYKLTAEELLIEVMESRQFMSPDGIAQMLIDKDPSLQLIDVRSKDQFEKFSLPNAINIPLESLLSREFDDVLNQDVKVNVFYSNSSNDANQAWMITRQLGYNNNYVLQGGLNYWVETIMNPEKPAEGSPNEEIAKYNFRMGANQALGGGLDAVAASPGTKTDLPKPVIQKTKKKKGAAGGC
ncbi:MAG: rhodanese-like domain-containing protein [Bacteroidota bacterium]|nr:rhodanese-like domain-containing protein [Bacteroidota bacterium]